MTQQIAKFFTLALLISALPSIGFSADNMPNWAGQSVLSAQTSRGLSIKLDSELQPLEINKIHSWLIHLSDENGKAVSDATIEFSGGMPEHNHGLPTQPQVTRELEPGVYLLEGLRFHMQGAWRLDLKINWNKQGSAIADGVIINFDL